MTDTTNVLFSKMARIMGRLDRLPKTGWNKHFKYHFVTDGDVSDAIRKELSIENIALFVSLVSSTREGKHTEAMFEFTFACGDTGETRTSTWKGESDDAQDKGLSKASTSAEKYFLLKTFVLSTGDKEDDPDSADPVKADKVKKPATTDATPSPSEPDAETWTQNDMAKETLTRLRNKAAIHWADADGKDLNYSHVYNRIAIIIGSEQRPTAFPAFCDMMRDDCELSAESVWQGVDAYKSDSES